MAELPTGTITFLYTDIEGSTARWEQQPQIMRTAVVRHLALLRQVIADHHGHLFRTVGDGVCAAFAEAGDAVAASLLKRSTRARCRPGALCGGPRATN